MSREEFIKARELGYAIFCKADPSNTSPKLNYERGADWAFEWFKGRNLTDTFYMEHYRNMCEKLTAEAEALLKERDELKAELFKWQDACTRNSENRKKAEADRDRYKEQLEIAREGLEKLSQYMAYNGDDWVSIVARETLAKLNGEEFTRAK